MKAIDIAHAEIGTVSSQRDGAVAFRVITPELTLDQRATVLGLHGKNVRVMLEPIDAPVSGLDRVDTDMGKKSPSARLHAVLFVLWKQKYGDITGPELTPFQHFYDARMERIIDSVKEELHD